MTPRIGLVIAGGLGSRLGGVRKADIRIGGRRLLDRVAGALGPFDQPLLVSTGPEDLSLPNGMLGLRDAPHGPRGPMTGLITAVEWLRDKGITSGVLVSVAVDTPFLPDDFTERQTSGLSDHPASFAAYGDDFYPPNAAWRIESLLDLPAQARAGVAPGSLKALHSLLGSARVDWTGSAATDPFNNLNTLEDLVALGLRARSRT